MTVVAILGEMRSGTSLLASIVHHLGYPVAITLGAPIAPRWDFDWEDVPLSARLLQKKANWPSHAWFASYLEERIDASFRLGTNGDIGLKSPYLALHWQAFLEGICEVEEELLVLKTARSRVAVNQSMRALPHLSEDDQVRIRAALEEISSDRVVEYEDLLEAGERNVREIASLLGVYAEDAIARAVHQIRSHEVHLCLW